jgi:acylglycerol lipase
VCRDPAALVAKYTDPLVYTGPIRIRTGTEILRLSSYLLRRLTNVSIPLLVLHGSDDQVTDPKGSQELYDQASTKHKNIILYDGLLHDILFEPQKEEITQDIIRWLDQRLLQLESCDQGN